MANRASTKAGRTDWKALDRLSDQEVEDRAASDPDNPPLTAEDFDTLRGVPKVRIIRMKLGMTQEAFAEAFGLSLATVRDWEQGRSSPDQSAQSFLRVIESIPDQVRTALQDAQPRSCAMAIELETDLNAFHQFLDRNGRNYGSLEEALQEFRAYQRELVDAKEKVEHALDQSARGESKPLDAEALKKKVRERLETQGITD